MGKRGGRVEGWESGWVRGECSYRIIEMSSWRHSYALWLGALKPGYHSDGFLDLSRSRGTGIRLPYFV